MKASIIALAAIVLVSVGAYFAIASVNSATPAPTAKAPAAFTQKTTTATPQTETAAPEVSNFNQAPQQDLLAAVDTTAPRTYPPAAPRVTNTRAPKAAPKAAVAQQAAPAAQQAAPAKTEVLTVDAQEDTTVTVNGVTVFVPKGQKVNLREAANGAVVISGENWQGVQVGNQTINSTGSTAIVLRGEDQPIQVLRGEVTATSNGVTTRATAGQTVAAPSATQTAAKTQTAKTQTNAKPATQTQAAATTTTSTTAPDFVADIPTSPAAEQATQDVEVEQECELSPSSPACF